MRTCAWGLARARILYTNTPPASMGWFAVGIDPLLPRIEERYTVYGLADDVKDSVSCMAEFAIIEEAAHLFELSSGNLLHRDPINGNCKVLALVRWRNTLQKKGIGQPHLNDSWQPTRNYVFFSF